MLPRKAPDKDALKLLAPLQARATQERGPLSLVKADAAVLAGLPPERAERALQTLLSEYRSHLLVTESGELIYEFAPGLVRRDARGAREHLVRAAAAIGHALWRGFQIGFKICIAVTLVGYTVFFALLGLVLMFASEDDGPGALIWWMLPDWMLGGRTDRQLPKKRFHRSVFDFVFGPAPAPALGGAPEGEERRLLRWIRTQAGRISTTDLVLRTGWSYARAEEEATRLLSSYDGEPEVTADGTLLYSFRDLRRTAQAPALALPEPRTGALVRYEAEPALTGNSAGMNTGIVALNAFNLVAALTLGPLCVIWLGLGGAAAALVTAVPLLFSLLFFSVPLTRALSRKLGRRARRRRNVRRALLAAIAARNGAPTSPADLCREAVVRLLDAAYEARDGESIGQGRGSATLLRLAQKELAEVLVELDGDVHAAEDGEGVRYEFPRLARELQAARTAQEEAQEDERAPGQVIFSSASEGAGV